MTKTGEQAAKEAPETAQVLRMSDYKPKSAPPTFARFRKHQETERPPYPGGIDARHANASQSCSGQRDRSWNEACEKAIRTGS